MQKILMNKKVGWSAAVLCVGLIAIFYIPSRAREFPVRTDSFDVRFRAVLLEPSRPTSIVNIGSEIQTSSITWITSNEGTLTASLWGTNAGVKFDSPDRHNINNILIVYGSTDRPEKTWEIWRHRHGFVQTPTQGYCWLTLNDEKIPMVAEEAQFFDQTLRHAWGYWVAKAVTSKLSSPNAYPMEEQRESNGWFNQTIPLTYDNKGLARAQTIDFQINLWQMPVKIQFDVQTGTTPTGAFVNLAGPYHWTYSVVEWRRLHGYEKNFWVGYTWLPGFPSDQKLSQEQGFLLDQLLDKTISYWVDVAIEMIRSDLNNQLTNKIESL